jgi:hypothetical protein
MPDGNLSLSDRPVSTLTLDDRAADGTTVAPYFPQYLTSYVATLGAGELAISDASLAVLTITDTALSVRLDLADNPHAVLTLDDRKP